MFNEFFYNFIYGTIHHHEYAAGRAEYLIKTYGPVRFLDVGCACGIMVQALRDQGAEAWGVDISDYANANKCTEFMVQGDMQKLPFDDNSFDVVHSWASFGYLDEAGTERALVECKRVGKAQYHTIDYQIASVPDMHKDGVAHYPYGYVFMQPRLWWDERITNDA